MALAGRWSTSPRRSRRQPRALAGRHRALPHRAVCRGRRARRHPADKDFGKAADGERPRRGYQDCFVARSISARRSTTSSRPQDDGDGWVFRTTKGGSPHGCWSYRRGGASFHSTVPCIRPACAILVPPGAPADSVVAAFEETAAKACADIHLRRTPHRRHILGAG